MAARLEPIGHQRARFVVGADHGHAAACLVEQVADLAEIADAVLAQQRVPVRGRRPARASSLAWSSPRATRTGGGWSIRQATRRYRRPIATTRCATGRVTSATAEVANEVSDAVAPRPMIAPSATAAARSNALSWASVRRYLRHAHAAAYSASACLNAMPALRYARLAS
jgi:hypothetical protein